MTKLAFDVAGALAVAVGVAAIALSLALLLDIFSEKQRYCREWGYELTIQNK